MKRFGPVVLALLAFAFQPSRAEAHSEFANITIDLGGAIPFGPGLTETNFRQFPDWVAGCESGYDNYFATCNPASGGFDMGLTLDFNTPVHIGIGAGVKATFFFRTGDPLDPVTMKENTASKDAYINADFFVLVKLRLLDMAKNYKRKWGSFDLDLGFGPSVLYGAVFFSLQQNIAYMFAPARFFQIGLYLGFVEAISLDKRKTLGYIPWHPEDGTGTIKVTQGYLNEAWMNLGLRINFTIPRKGKGGSEGGEGGFGEGGEGGEGSDFAEQMKIMDSDGDGLSDYAEMMLGTSSTNKDSDGDTIPDGIEDKNLNGVRDYGETDPTKFDSDGGGVNDSWEISHGYDPTDFEDDDRDRDGVIDDKDSCLGTPGGASVGTSGCPTLTESVTLDQVTFVEGTSELNPEAYNQLDSYAMILLQDPSLEVVILVFGPPKPKKGKAPDLTGEQAQAIKDYLVLKGIDEIRISVSGEGPTPEGPIVELQPVIPFY